MPSQDSDKVDRQLEADLVMKRKDTIRAYDRKNSQGADLTVEQLMEDNQRMENEVIQLLNKLNLQVQIKQKDEEIRRLTQLKEQEEQKGRKWQIVIRQQQQINIVEKAKVREEQERVREEQVKVREQQKKAIDLNRIIQEQNKENQQLKQSLRNLNEQMTRLRQELEQIKREIQIWKYEANNRKLQTEVIRKVCETLDSQKGQYALRNQMLQTSIAQERESSIVTNSQLAQLKKQNEQLREQLERVKDSTETKQFTQTSYTKDNEIGFIEIMERIHDIDRTDLAIQSLNLTVELDQSRRKEHEIVNYFRSLKEINWSLKQSGYGLMQNTPGFLSEFLERQERTAKHYQRIKQIRENSLKFFYYYVSVLEQFFQVESVVSWRQEVYEFVERNFFNPKLQATSVPLPRLPTKISETNLSDYFSPECTLKAYRQSSLARISICNQYSVTVEQQTLRRQNNDNFASQVNSRSGLMSEQSSHFQVIYQQLEQIRRQINSNQINSLNSMEVRYDEGMVNCLDALQDNAIAQLLSRLLKQNAAIKKCLAQMIRNQEEISQQNNEAFFEECVEKRESTLSTRETLLFSATRTNNVKETMRDLSLEKTRVTGGPSELNNKQKDQCCIY